MEHPDGVQPMDTLSNDPEAMCVLCEHPVNPSSIADEKASVLSHDAIETFFPQPELPLNESRGFIFVCVSTKTCTNHAKAMQVNHDHSAELLRLAKTVKKRESRGNALVSLAKPIEFDSSVWFARVDELSQPSESCIKYAATAAAEEAKAAEEATEPRARVRLGWRKLVQRWERMRWRWRC